MVSLVDRRILVTGALFAIVLFFQHFASGGLHAYFTSDDVMNLQHLHGYYTTPFYRVVLDVFNPLTSAYRPLGGVFYRAIYPIAGYNPAPFRYVCFFLLLVNMALAFRLLRLLSGSIEAALLGLLVICYHASMSELYYNTGTIYDILCYMLVVPAMSSYIDRREHNCKLSGRFVAGLLVMNLLALQAKEIGCMLPAGIFLYEVCYRGFTQRRPARDLMPVLLTGLLTAVMLLHRLLTPNEMSGNPLYQPRLSLDYYLHSCARYHNLLFYSNDLFSVPGLLCLWAAMALLAGMLRSRQMAFGLSFWLLGLVPIALIPGRAGFVMYLPMLGLALYVAVLAVRLRKMLVKPPRLRLASQAALFGLSMAGLAIAHTARQAYAAAGVLQTDRDNRAVLTELRRLHPKLPPKARVLFVEDPFPREPSWFLTLALRLMYNDPGIFADRVKNFARAHSYDFVFSYTGGRLIELPHPPCPMDPSVSPDPMDDSSPRICWQGPWTSGEFPQSSDGTLTFANQKDATATVAFEGTGLTYVYTKAWNRGKAAVTIDGILRGVIDQYAPDIVWQASTTFSGLTPGKHTAEVRVLQQRNPASSDYYVDVDAFLPHS